MKFTNNPLYLLMGILIGMLLTMLTIDLTILMGINLTFIIISILLTDALSNLDTSLKMMKLIEVNQDINMRCLKFSMTNDTLLEGEDLFKAIYESLMSNSDFIKFGYKKIIILSCTLESGKEYNLHCNTLLTNDTSFEDYYSCVSEDLSNYNNLQYGYHNESVLKYNVLCWNVDNHQNLKIKQTYNALEVKSVPKKYRNIFKNSGLTIERKSFSTSSVNFSKNWYKGLIQPLSLVNKKGILKQKHVKPFFTMDLETMTIGQHEVVVAISSCGYYNNKIDTRLFLIDPNLLQVNQDLAVKQLWCKYFKYLEEVINNDITIIDKLTIFAHNLGNFDGYFLYKGLNQCYNPKQVTAMLDETNTFISITNLFPLIEWKDSLRIFPCSLDKLCKNFGVEGKSTRYNSEFNNINLFDNSELFELFKEYSKQDAKALYDALRTAQAIYWDEFKIDIESVYSTATLSLKVFRTNFQDKNIYILPQNMDAFIRKGYYGGGTDVYEGYAQLVYYYDVNSLYPFAMLNPMPHKALNQGKIIDLSNRSLDSFFGFAEVKIFCPLNMAKPVLPFHKDGKTIYPVGSWTATYFSEELKAIQSLGYQITLIKGIEFDKTDLFSGYVKHFYDKKKYAKTATEREMAKLQLNNLYGYFGRKQIGLVTTNVRNDELTNILSCRIVKAINPINEDYSTILTYSNINQNLLELLNNEFQTIGSDTNFVMSNVAIAAAVTSYARIHMIPFKIDPNTLYTDTDSHFTTKPIDPSLLGLDIGLMKDELKGQLIQEAYFIGPKKYGYYIIDPVTGQRKEFSVFSGVPRNSLSFQDVKSIYNGKTITKIVPNRFYKSFNDLNITIKDSTITIKNTNDKKLVNNKYLPPVINSGYNDPFKILFNKFRNIIIKNLKKFF